MKRANNSALLDKLQVLEWKGPADQAGHFALQYGVVTTFFSGNLLVSVQIVALNVQFLSVERTVHVHSYNL